MGRIKRGMPQFFGIHQQNATSVLCTNEEIKFNDIMATIVSQCGQYIGAGGSGDSIVANLDMHTSKLKTPGWFKKTSGVGRMRECWRALPGFPDGRIRLF
jgi:hypothetical protein